MKWWKSCQKCQMVRELRNQQGQLQVRIQQKKGDIRPSLPMTGSCGRPDEGLPIPHNSSGSPAWGRWGSCGWREAFTGGGSCGTLQPMSIRSSVELIANPLRSGGRAGVFWGAGIIKSCLMSRQPQKNICTFTHTHAHTGETTYHCHQLDSDHQDLRRTHESSFKSFKLLIDYYMTFIVFFWPHYYCNLICQLSVISSN